MPNFEKGYANYEFEMEMDRTDRLCALFEDLETEEREVRATMCSRHRRYFRKFTDYGKVSQVYLDGIDWVREEDGEQINIPLTKAICDELQIGDELQLSVGLRDGVWRVIYLGAIATPIPNDIVN